MNVKSGTRRHYIPATLIGLFSRETGFPIRERKVHVLRRRVADVFVRKAEALCAQANLYKDADYDLDFQLCHDEGRFRKAIGSFAPTDDGWLDADQWVILAHFVASLFARAPDYKDQQRNRLHSFLGPSHLFDSAISDVTRVLEAQRISAAVLRANWRFVWSPDAELITNDRAMGFARISDADPGRYFVPLEPHLGALVGGPRTPKPIRWRGSRWEVEMPMDCVSGEEARTFNVAMWAICRSEAYGPSLQGLEGVKEVAGADPEVPSDDFLLAFAGGAFLGSTSSEMRDDETLAYQLYSRIAKPENPAEPPDLWV